MFRAVSNGPILLAKGDEGHLPCVLYADNSLAKKTCRVIFRCENEFQPNPDPDRGSSCQQAYNIRRK